MLQLAKEIVAGRRLTAEDDLTRLVTADDGGEILFRSGANATLTGDMLTTVGNNTAQDREMLSLLGYRLKNLRDKGEIER